MQRIAILDGYFDGYRRRRRHTTKRRTHRRGGNKRIGICSRKCAGKGKRARKVCMRKCMK